VRIVPRSFEAWPLEPQAFDLVLAAQSFHWIAIDVGLAKAAAALRPGGAIALVWHVDVSHDTPFWQATLPIYERYLPATAAGSPTLADRVAGLAEALRSGHRSVTCGRSVGPGSTRTPATSISGS
jgi:hypothetical protein